jgi:hypothetical protein
LTGRPSRSAAADHALLAEAAAHVGDDDADRAFVQAQAGGGHGADLVRGLGAGVQDELVFLGVPGGDRSAGLQGQGVLAAGGGVHLDHAGRGGEDVVDALGGEHGHVDQGVAGGFVVYEGCAGGQRGGVGHDRGEDVVPDLGGLDAVLGGVRVARHDDGQRLADIADPVAGQDGHVGGHELVERPVQPGRDVREVQVGGVEHGHHARYFAYPVEVELRDAGMRDGAAHELGVQHAGQRDVVDEASSAGEEAGVFTAAYRAADEPVAVGAAVGAVRRGRGVRRGGTHREIASSQARRTRVRIRVRR